MQEQMRIPAGQIQAGDVVAWHTGPVTVTGVTQAGPNTIEFTTTCGRRCGVATFDALRVTRAVPDPT